MAKAKTLIVIPARYESSRLPGKPLADIAGKTLLERVWRQAKKVEHAGDVIIATDDERIVKAAKSFDAQVMMTSANHQSGTDRAAEVAESFRDQGYTFEVVANLQGDVPFIRPEIIDQVIKDLLLSSDEIEIATLATPIADAAEFQRSSAVKVVTDFQRRALYFSRAPIPFLRQASSAEELPSCAMKHIGLYVYRTKTLLELTNTPPSELERIECLEQLRALQLGKKILVTQVERELLQPAIEVDTPEDLERAREYAKRLTK